MISIYTKDRDMDEGDAFPCPTQNRVKIKAFELAMTSLTYGIPQKIISDLKALFSNGKHHPNK